jgi:hypothetical protein
MITVFDKFKDITNVDIEAFFTDFQDFVNFDYQNIQNYYTRGTSLDGDVVDKLQELNDFSKEIRNTWNNFSSNLSDTFDFWELLDLYETVDGKISTMLNSQKWFRSNKGLVFDTETEKDYILKQGQTLSNLADEVGYLSPNDDWVDIALRNDLEEEDYTNAGGTKIKIVFQNNLNYKLNSVLDSISGEKIYGKDLQKKLVYENEDLKILSYKNTIIQTYNTLLGLFKGSVPEFLGDGIDKGLIGNNINAIQYPILIRQLVDLFSKDDSFIEFSVDNIFREEDNVFLETSVKSRIGEVLKQTLTLV